MRIIIFTIIITLLVFTISFKSVSFLEKTSVNMISPLKNVEENIKRENWEKAEENLWIFEEKWKGNKLIWALLIDHSEIDNIELSIVHIKSYITSRDLTEAKKEIAGLYLYLRHIPETEKLNLKNIF